MLESKLQNALLDVWLIFILVILIIHNDSEHFLADVLNFIWILVPSECLLELKKTKQPPCQELIYHIEQLVFAHDFNVQFSATHLLIAQLINDALLFLCHDPNMGLQLRCVLKLIKCLAWVLLDSSL